MQTSTLKPGLLVSLKTAITGNVSYETKMLEAARLTATGAALARWETARTINDPVEHENSIIARSNARGRITKVCAQSGFGLLCPLSRAPELEIAVAEARGIIDEFNAGAKFASISLYVICGRIAADDAEAVRAINSEVRALLERMKRGVRNLDPTEIRKAATAARSLGAMLSSDAVERVSIAISTARGAAKQIAKAGNLAAAEIDETAIRRIAEQRLAFLDLGDAADVAKPEAQARTLDFDPGQDAAEVQRKLSAALVDLPDSLPIDPEIAIPDGDSRLADYPPDVGAALEEAYPWGYRSGEQEA